jgi:hypothetical protein
MTLAHEAALLYAEAAQLKAEARNGSGHEDAP